MSSAQPVETTEDSQPGSDRAAETTSLAASVMSRARWMQRVLSPWTQRWLSATGVNEAAERVRGQQPFVGLTGADAERTLARVHVQYESHTNLEMPTTGSSLPLAGAVERPAPAVEAAVPAAPAAPAAATATGAAAETPHFSSSILLSSAASRTDRPLRSSTIFAKSAMEVFLLKLSVPPGLPDVSGLSGVSN